MGYISFHEYVEKNKKSPKAKTALVADYDGPKKDAPELGKMPDNAGGVAQGGKVLPYKGGKDAADPNKGKLADGLGGKVEQSKAGVVGQPSKELKSYPMKTQEWIEKTKGLSLAEFTKQIRDSRLAGVASPSKTYESIKETVAVCKENSSYINDVVLEMKRQGVFEAVLGAMASQPESFNVIAKLMESDGYARKLVMALDEMVGPPVGDEGMGDDKMPSLKHKLKSKLGDMGDEEGMDGEDMGDEDLGGEGDEEDMGDEDLGGEGDEEGMDGEDLGGEDMGGDSAADMGGEDMGGGEMDMPKPSAKDKLMKAMKMMGHM